MSSSTPGQNLTREEAATRADLVTVHSYDVVLDLATGPTTFATTSIVRFSATPGAETFVDFVGESVESVTLNGTALDPAAVWTDSRIALPGLAAENELVVEATALYTNTGEGMHRFVDPVDGEVTGRGQGGGKECRADVVRPRVSLGVDDVALAHGGRAGP